MIRKSTDPILRACTAVSAATVAFAEAADKLEHAADDLVAIAAAAENEANIQNLRAGGARVQAADARRKALKIRDLLA